MANEKLSLSAEGLASLKQDEGVIDGLYDDPSGYCTSGVGHLVHQSDKWGCFLLQAAGGDDDFKKSVLKQWPGKPYETPYLARGAAFVEKKFDDLKGKAAEAAKEAVAQKRYKKSFDKLTAAEQAVVTETAKGAVDEQAKALAKTTDATLTDDVLPFEKAVREKVTIELTQAEFDALVSLSFNIGIPAFGGSGVLTEVNKGKHRSGEAKDRKAAIDAIDGAFAKWNKSGGQVLDGLTKRRKAEADRFLKGARDELAVLEKAASKGQPGAPAAVSGPAPVSGPALVKP